MDKRVKNNLIKYIILMMFIMIGCFVVLPVRSIDAAEIIAEGKCGDPKVNDGEDMSWVLEDTGTLTISGTGDMYDFWTDDNTISTRKWKYYSNIISNVVIENGVTSIGRSAFNKCSNLTSIVIPEGVTSIGDYAFSECSSLTSVTIPESVTSIGEFAFSSSGLSSVDIPGSVTSIGNLAFSSENLTSITISEGVTNIWAYAFKGCYSLTSVTIPESVTSIGDSAFSGCSSLTSITIPGSVTSIGDYAFSGCSSLTSVYFKGIRSPNLREDWRYGYIDPDFGTFGPNANTIFYVPAGRANNYSQYLNGIGYKGEIFEVIEYTVTFKVVNGSWNEGDSSDRIVKLSGCVGDLLSLNATDIPAVGETPYFTYMSGDWDITPNTSMEITGDTTFVYTYDQVPKEGTVGECTWELSDDLKILTISGTGDMDNFEWDSELNDSTAPWRYTSTDINNVVIENGVTNIGAYAFKGCSSLISVTIPESVTSIGNQALKDCSSLTSVIFKGNNPPELGNDVFGTTSENFIIFVPTSSYYTYKEVLRNNGYEGEINNAIEYTVTFKVVNGSWNEGGSSDKIVKLSGYEGELLKLKVTNIPAVGNNPNSNYVVGSWDYTPETSIVITGDMTFTYTYIRSFEYTVTFKVVNGSWNEGGSSDKIVKLSGCDGEILKLKDTDIPAVGNNPNYTYVAGSWDNTPDTSIVIIDDMTFTYTYNPVSKEGAVGECTWKLSDDFKTLTISGTGNMEDFTWNNELNSTAPWIYASKELNNVVIEKGVTNIGAYAFYKCSGLTSITIPEGVTSIGALAFCGCSALTSIIIPEGVTRIERMAFSGCSALISVIIHEGAVSIGESAFSGCSGLTSIILPEGTVSIGDYVFERCSSLTSITIPGSVTSIGKKAFKGCRNLIAVNFKCSNPPEIGEDIFIDTHRSKIIYVPVGKVNTYKEVFENNDYVWKVQSNQTIEYTVTFKVVNGSWNAGDSTDKIVKLSGFEGELLKLKYTDIPAVGNKPNSNCLAGSWDNTPNIFMEITSDITFTYTYDHFPKEGIVGDCIWNLSDDFKTLTISGTGDMGDFVWNNELNDSTAPWIYDSTEINNVVIEKGVTNIGAYAFCGCSNLTSITIPEGVTSIGALAFMGCSNLTSIIIPEGVTSIESSTFEGCSSLTSIIIPESVTSIETYAFCWCSSLTSITIPESVTCIGTNAFCGCICLITVYFKGGNPPEINNDIFVATPKNILIYVPVDAVDKYIASNGWISYAENIEPLESAAKIGDVNGDGVVNAKDVTTLRRYLAGGWNVTIMEANADVDGDGEITPKDVTILRRFMVGGWGVSLG